MPYGEEALSYLLVGGRSGTEAKTRDDACGICGHEQTETHRYHPRLLDHPISARPASHPSPRRFASLKGASPSCGELGMGISVGLHHVRQLQGYLLDEAQAVTHQPVELRAVGQRGEGTDQTGACIAVEIPLAREACPSGEDGEGEDLAGAQGCIWSGALFLMRAGLAEVVHHNVEYGEEGVLKSSIGRFLSLRGLV
jgi:hypothetical protein